MLVQSSASPCLRACAVSDSIVSDQRDWVKLTSSLDMGNNLHGGAVALLFDITTSMAIQVCTREGFWDTGHVSRNR
jgi:acyl-coenzyme A thioesterase PaaI-like protein